jgi:O-antigen/teichoic acid export membrane protein
VRGNFLPAVVLVVGSTGAVAAVGLLRSVVIAKAMGPAAFGLWQLCLVAIRIGGESHLGALHAMALEGPVLRGAGREAEAVAMERRSLGTALLLGLFAGTIAGLFLYWEGRTPLTTAAILLALTVTVQQAFQAEGVFLRTRRRFARLAVLQVTFATLHLGGLFLLVPTRYISGVLLAWAGAQVVALLLVRSASSTPLPRPVIPGPREAIAVVRRGLPTWLIGASFLVLLQSDRIIVGGFLGREDLGLYGILIMGGSVLLLLPDAASMALWPFAGERFGAAGRDPASLGGMARDALGTLFPVLAATLLLALQASEVLVRRVVPAFEPSLLPLRFYLPGMYLLALTLPLRYLLITVGEEARVLRITVAVLGATAAAQVAMAAAGAGILGVAIATGAGGSVMFVLLTGQAVRTLSAGVGLVRIAVTAALLGAAAMVFDRAFELAAPDPTTATGIGIRCGIPLILLVFAGFPVLSRLRSG